MAQVQSSDVDIAVTNLEGVLIALPVWLAAGRYFTERDDEVDAADIVVTGGFLALLFSFHTLTNVIFTTTQSDDIRLAIRLLEMFVIVIGVGVIYSIVDFSDVTSISGESRELLKAILMAGGFIFLIYLLLLILRVVGIVL